MASLSPDLRKQLQETLLRCGPFDQDWQWQALFVDERISAWRNDIPQAKTPTQRVRAIIFYLLNQENKNGENGLVLFLDVLADEISSEVRCHIDLVELAEKVQGEIQARKDRNNRRTRKVIEPTPPEEENTPQPENPTLGVSTLNLPWQTIGYSAIGIIVLILSCWGISSLIRSLMPDESPTPPATQLVENTVAPTQTLTIPNPTTHTPTHTPQPPTNTPSASHTPRPTSTPTATLDPNVPPPNPKQSDEWTRPKDGMVLVYVPAGTFTMGSETGDSDEQPEHQVMLDGFWIDKTEVTEAQFTAFLNDEGNQTEEGVTWYDNDDFNARIDLSGENWVVQSGFVDHPAIEMSWYGAQAYCEWVGGQLPSEAQWEYAARGSESFTYPWGIGQPSRFSANYNNNVRGTVPVGSYQSRSWVGAFDMAGNVWEWVNDWYDGNYYANSPSENPMGPESGTSRVLRGGSWFFGETFLRSANRAFSPPSTADELYGFRCIVSVESTR